MEIKKREEKFSKMLFGLKTCYFFDQGSSHFFEGRFWLLTLHTLGLLMLHELSLTIAE